MKYDKAHEHDRVRRIIALLEKATQDMGNPMSEQIAQEYNRDPYLILISCLLSLRSRDVQTYKVVKDLFQYIKTPQEAVEFPLRKLESIIHSIGFYRRKARLIKEVSQDLINRFHGKVPDNEEDLLSLPGVGRKTSSLVLGVAFGIPAICVDTHVHRVTNRLGIVKTKNTAETEIELKKIIPKNKWIELNRLFVLWGQNICVPISPKCSQCVLSPICPKIGVTRRR